MDVKWNKISWQIYEWFFFSQFFSSLLIYDSLLENISNGEKIKRIQKYRIRVEILYSINYFPRTENMTFSTFIQKRFKHYFYLHLKNHFMIINFLFRFLCLSQIQDLTITLFSLQFKSLNKSFLFNVLLNYSSSVIAVS